MIGLATAPETSQAGVDRRGIMGTSYNVPVKRKNYGSSD
jgi:hypothetical protein